MAFETIEGYEILQLCGDFGLSAGIGYARFRFDAGQGYRSSVLVDGPITGLKNWKLNYKALRQTLDKPAYYLDDPFTQADYLWDFYCRHQVSGLPFVILCPKNNQYYLADFSDDIFSLELLMIKLWSTGLSLSQRRVINVSVFDFFHVPGVRWYDASRLDLEDSDDVTELPELLTLLDMTLPTIPLDFEMTGEEGSLDLETSWMESTDEGSGIAGYELRLTG
jgi:hypothetical protein